LDRSKEALRHDGVRGVGEIDGLEEVGVSETEVEGEVEEVEVVG
jgi:hypothetical protein